MDDDIGVGDLRSTIKKWNIIYLVYLNSKMLDSRCDAHSFTPASVTLIAAAITAVFGFSILFVV